MSFKFNSSDISINVLLSSLMIVTLGLGILMFNYHLVEGDYLSNNKENSKNFRESEKQLKFLLKKDEVNQLVLNVNLSSFYVWQELKSKSKAIHSTVEPKEYKDLWAEKITPLIDQLDTELDKYPDEIKSDFFKITDNIYRIKKGHHELLSKRNDSLFIANKKRNKINKISQYTGELNTTSTDFLVNHLVESGDKFVEPKYKEDYWEVIALSSFFFLIGVLVIMYRSTRYLKYPIRHLESILKRMYEGSLPNAVGLKNKDYLLIGRYANGINETLKKLQIFAGHVGQGEFDSDRDLKFIEKGEFGEALHKMQENLLNIAREDSQRSHVNQGLARFSEILGNNSNNLERFGDDVILNLVQFLNANQGALFVIKEEKGEVPCLELTSCYAYEKKKYLNRKVVKGQGLVGQCWQEEKRIYMTDVPSDYINITSGLGYSTPRCVLIIPLIFNDKTQGVIELASFKELENYELNFVEKVAQSIGSALSSVKVNSKTQVLLKQSEQLTRKMKGQEEEMRKNVEELRMTQEESQTREEEHLREISRLKKRLEEYERNF